MKIQNKPFLWHVLSVNLNQFIVLVLQRTKPGCYFLMMRYSYLLAQLSGFYYGRAVISVSSWRCPCVFHQILFVD